jgi:hypothetical protein
MLDRMLTKIGLAIAAVLLALVGLVALQPSDYKVARSTQIAVPPDGVFAFINDLHTWEDWSPWAKLDPAMKTTYSGAAAGPGAVYHWVSTKNDVGEGRMTITGADPPESLTIRLEFLKPFESLSETRFTIRPAGNGSQVDWVITGHTGFVEKAVTLAMGGMDKLIGPDFERGLAQLKSLAEKQPTPAAIY